MADRRVTYLNLLDKVILLSKGGKIKTDEIFRKIVMEYFFAKECENKKVMGYIKNFELPPFFELADSLFDIDNDQFSNYIHGTTVTDSFAGKIMLSKQYLQSFHPDHPSELSKLPFDVQSELIDNASRKNNLILSSFDKMRKDISADKKRTITVLVALILKNIQIRTGINYIELKRPAAEIINDLFHNADSVFTGSPEQCTMLTDDKIIKSLAKEFCIIRKNRDLSDMADLFKTEFERFKTRALFAISMELRNAG